MFGFAGDLLRVSSGSPTSQEILQSWACQIGHSNSLSSDVDGSGSPASPWLEDTMLGGLNWLVPVATKGGVMVTSLTMCQRPVVSVFLKPIVNYL